MMAVSVDAKSGANAVAAKKPFSIDKDYLLVAVLFLLVLFSAKSYALIEAPTQVTVTDKAVFYVDITNQSNQQVDLKLNFYSPVKASVSAPSFISPNEKVTAKITISNNKYDKDTNISATIEAVMGDKVEQSPVNLVFKQNSSVSSAVSGMFSLSFFNQEIGKFSLIEWVAFWVLVIIAAVLLIAFVARITK